MRSTRFDDCNLTAFLTDFFILRDLFQVVLCFPRILHPQASIYIPPRRTPPRNALRRENRHIREFFFFFLVSWCRRRRSSFVVTSSFLLDEENFRVRSSLQQDISLYREGKESDEHAIYQTKTHTDR